MLNLILGRIKSGKTSRVIDILNSRQDFGSLLVVPEGLSHSIERLLCEKCGNTVSSFAEVTSFRRLATKIKGEIGGLAAQTVSDGKRILLLYSAMKTVAPTLTRFKQAVANPARLTTLLESVDEFKAYGITPEKLAGASLEVSRALSEKLSDLANIYAAYEASLGEEECDGYDELDFVAKMLREHSFFEEKTVFFDGFSGFTAAEFDIIEAAIRSARDVYITLPLDSETSDGDENGIFDKARTTKDRLLEICKKNGMEYREENLKKEMKNALSHIDAAVFGDVKGKTELSDGEITIARAGGVYHECELAAAYILDCIRDKKMRYRDFSVAVCDETKYLPVCEMVFSRYGIPVYMNKSEDMTSKPLIALVIAAFDCIIKGFKTESVMEYIKTGFSGVSARNLDIFENYLYTWAPRPSEWKKGCDFTKNPLGLGEDENDESRELLRSVNCTRRRIYEPIKKLSDAISRGKTGDKCAEALYEFINDINLPRRNDAYIYLSKTMGDFKAAQESERVMSVLCEVIDCIGTVCADEEIKTEDLALLFKLAASKYELGTIPTTLDCVLVGGVSRADGERCKVRLVLGANDGEFPKNSDSAGLLSDKDRQELSDFGIELAPGLCDRIFEDYRVVHDILSSGETALYISSDTYGEGGEENPEAVVVGNIRKAFDVTENRMSVHDARLRAKVPCFDESIMREGLSSLWENDEEYRKKLELAKLAKNCVRGPIKKRENIKAIFGDKVYMSSTSAEKFSSCRYSYFLQYGLKANPRKRAEISYAEAGIIMHYVLEKVIKRLSEDDVYERDIALRYSDEAIDEYVAEFFGGEEVLSGRMSFLVERIKKSVKAAVAEVCDEITKSKFRPREFELRFSKSAEDAIPPIEINGESSTVLFNGAIDRVDLYEDGEDVYFRVIDYKSGKKAFSLDQSLNGIGMQMLLYMFALEDMGLVRYGKKIKPAGVMYVLLSGKMSSSRGKKTSTKRREGVVLRDLEIIDAMEKGEEKEYLPVSFLKSGALSKNSSVLSGKEFDLVRKRVFEIIAKIGDEIMNGEISPNPYIYDQKNACEWCNYKSVCAFDDVRGDDRMRDLIEVSGKDILAEGEVKDSGNDDMDR